MVGLTREEWKHLPPYRGAVTIYWENGVPEKYWKLEAKIPSHIRFKEDYLIKVKNPPFSD